MVSSFNPFEKICSSKWINHFPIPSGCKPLKSQLLQGQSSQHITSALGNAVQCVEAVLHLLHRIRKVSRTNEWVWLNWRIENWMSERVIINQWSSLNEEKERVKQWHHIHECMHGRMDGGYGWLKEWRNRKRRARNEWTNNLNAKHWIAAAWTTNIQQHSAKYLSQ